MDIKILQALVAVITALLFLLKRRKTIGVEGDAKEMQNLDLNQSHYFREDNSSSEGGQLSRVIGGVCYWLAPKKDPDIFIDDEEIGKRPTVNQRPKKNL